MLLDGRFLEMLAQRLDVGRDVQRLDFLEPVELMVLALGKEPAGRMEVSRPVFLLRMVTPKNSR